MARRVVVEGMDRCVCIHGHFYQPPRENPWLEAIERQDSADPYHDWNERITAECYAPNAFSRILDGEDRIRRIVNNYSRISFDCGPTLLQWMEASAPEVYAAILEADREGARAFSGHGGAMAQAYNHMILPLANARDRRTQVAWGIRDFRRRFLREPEGMWLPETAVDLDTLEALAEAGIRFTVLAPSQARTVRRKGAREWRDTHGSLDPSGAYECPLPSGRRIALFFYDGPISRAVAFERLLSKGEQFAGRLLGAFDDARARPQLVHIATDGETFGHHHAHGDMALAYALEAIESRGATRLTNYGEFLERHPPRDEVQIHENSSWSCVHGVERWRRHCGCSSGQRPDWTQEWRAPLRDALDWLRDELAGPYAQAAAGLLREPWTAREDYVDVVLDRSAAAREAFLRQHALVPSPPDAAPRTWKLLELQRQLMLMFTSCGWFFDELTGIETVQVLQHAGRALQLAEEALDRSWEAPFLDRLDRARSNLTERGGGRQVYEERVRPSRVDHLRVAGHYAIRSLFQPYEASDTVYCYEVTRRDERRWQAGAARLVTGRAEVTSRVTGESRDVGFGALHWGDHHLSGGAGPFTRPEDHSALEEALGRAFTEADFPEVSRLIDRHFAGATCSLRSLFRDEQRAVLHEVLGATLKDAETDYRQIYERRVPLMRFLTGLGIPLPRPFRAAAELVLNASLRECLEDGRLDLERVAALLEEAAAEGVALDVPALSYALARNIERLTARYAAAPDDLALLRQMTAAVALARTPPFALDLWAAQNRYHQVTQRVRPEMLARADAGGREAREWVAAFADLGRRLGFRAEG